MKYHHLIACLAAAIAGLVTPAAACSVDSDYRVPTNLELAEQAPSIILGRVIGQSLEGSFWDRKLRIEPIEAIKGELPDGIVEIKGSALVPEDDERRFGLLSNPYELEQAHPLSYIGACIRHMFPRGTTALFFIRQQDGEWVPAGGPFSRWAEDVLSADAPWLRLVRLYASVADLSAEEREVVLISELERLASHQDDLVAQLMARDIARQLAGPNEKWNDIMHRIILADSEKEASVEAIAELLVQDAESAAQEVEEKEAGPELEDAVGAADTLEYEAPAPEPK